MYIRVKGVGGFTKKRMFAYEGDEVVSEFEYVRIKKLFALYQV